MNVVRACLALVLAVGGLAPSSPAEAQPGGKKAPRIGYLSGSDPATGDAFRRGLRDLGYVDGQNK